MEQVENAALAHHRVVVQLLLQPFPELHRPFVERLIARQQIVGADDGGVAPGIAGADHALFQHRHIAEAVHLGEVIGGGQPMPAAADDDHVISGLGRGVAPGRGPALLAGEPIGEDAEEGIAHEGSLGTIAAGHGENL